ncbi:MAG TPA: hypothetical protein VNN72_20005 [Polyangiaceae bacterium]|nr:hypothetical protein [Polyangiaceae bacterium]
MGLEKGAPRGEANLLALGWLSLVAAVAVLTLVSCRGESPRRDGSRAAAPSAPPPKTDDAVIDAALTTLRHEETALRARTDFATLPPSSRSLGANPYALAALPGSGGFVGILRGDSRLVLLDAELSERSALPTAPSPSALAVDARGNAFVTSPLSPAVERFRVQAGRLERGGELAVPGAVALGAVVADERSLIVLDFGGDQLFAWSAAESTAVPPHGPGPERRASCRGPIRSALSARYFVVDCLFDHSLVVYSRGDDGAPDRVVGRATHDGPLWSVALLELGDELFVAAGGVEDHPLVRQGRVFGYVDSFVFLYSLSISRAAPMDGGGPFGLTRREATNVSELGVITPKALALEARDSVPVTLALGYGSDSAVELAPGRAPAVRPSVPGCSALSSAAGRHVCASPLFDAWVELDGAPRFHPARAARPDDPAPSERLGEALFFTGLMAPDASSRGRLSRFTCETCHFEGGTDGRVHNSGRDDIRVTTRPLFGLFNDAPHFSRAHDRDLTSVCHNEFAVANRGNPVDPWFTLDPARFSWLAALGIGAEKLSPLDLRRSLLAFLARFSHEESPAVAAHPEPRRFTPGERRGAGAFRERCLRCHAARLVASEPASEVAFERWESLTLSNATPIVWARGDYEKTGVVPYVDARGTRIPSLRRLYTKRPYLTNGSAPTLASVLALVRFSEREFSHAPSDAAGLAPLEARERADLLEFLRLL